MKIAQDNIWLCGDCLAAAVNNDYSGLDYYYSLDERDKIERDIKAGLARLGEHLVPDFSTSGGGVLELSHSPCNCCGSVLAGSRYRFATLEE